MPRRLLILMSLALPAAGQQAIVDFDGLESERKLYSVSGPSSTETDPSLVRSGTASLRVTLGPPQKWPGLRILAEGLRQKGHSEFCIDVFNASSATATIWTRIDDASSKGQEPELVRRRFDLAPGWNVIRLPLARLDTPSGRSLDPENLALIILHQNLPKTGLDLVFDHARFEGAVTRPDRAALEAFAKSFLTRYATARTYEDKRALILECREHLDPVILGPLERRVLDEEEDARLIEAGIGVLGRSREPAMVQAMVEMAKKAEGSVRWRWLDALGRTGQNAALDHLRNVAETTTDGQTETAALRALGRPGMTGIMDLLGPTRPGTWQVKASRVEILRRLGLGPAFPILIDHVLADEARVRTDAHEALVALAGRDLGDRADLWHAWWNAEAERRKTGQGSKIGSATSISSPYGTYYGLPLSPGRLCFVIDISGSMKAVLNGAAQDYVKKDRHLSALGISTRLDLAKAELERAVKALPDGAALQLVWYETEVQVWSRDGARKATPDAKSDLLRRSGNLRAAGSTNIYGALLAAFDGSRSPTPRVAYRDSVDTIFLLSDGQPTAGEIRDVQHLIADIKERNRTRRIRINTIGLGDPGSALLSGLARATGGTFVDLAR